MQARAGVLDELLASGALQDATVPGGRDDLQSQMDALTAGHQLARMKAQLPASAAPAAIEGPGTTSADPSSPPGQPATSRARIPRWRPPRRCPDSSAGARAAGPGDDSTL